MEIIDAHTHVFRSQDHGREAFGYFLSRNPRSGHPAEPVAYGTVGELRQMMASNAVSGANILMFTWSGQYWRDGQYTLPDEGTRREAAAEELRLRIVDRIRDNNAWAGATVAGQPDLTYFCGVDAVLMGEEEMLAELEARVAEGASGVKIVPRDMRIRGDDPRLRPLFDWCARRGVPVLTESSGHGAAFGRPSGFEKPLTEFPSLKLIFAHCGHSPVFGEGADVEVVELARRFENVCADLSLRVLEVADGKVEPERMAQHIRRIGVDRVLYGSNFVLAELLQPVADAARPQRVRTESSLQAFLRLPLTGDELAAVAAGNFRRLTSR
ncbi:amidohydrolase family protein [Nonomuraea sp. 10N515B]|uniref:amidohydrolase family protein n=1 Tax=Nonomuraea sp. 10N515B TaxID=3457422 RepID=UPI003FCC5E2D